MERKQTEKIYEKLLENLPGGVNSPVRAFKGLGITPLIVERGKADSIFDIDGNQFIDFNLAWGSLILGHVHPEVVKETTAQILKGSSFGITTLLEYRFAEKFKQMIPSIEKMRVVCSGTEATMTAVRLARGYTGKNVIVKFNGHYHGHSDLFLIKAGSGVHEMCQDSSSKGVPKEFIKHTISLPFNDCQALTECFNLYGEMIAGVILEVVAGNIGVVPATTEFIELLRKLTSDYGVVLIFDEVITGFRLGKQGAMGLYGVIPDLSTYSKIVGGGYPVGVVCGKAKIMDLLAPVGPVYQAGTLSGNPVALSGALAVLHQVDQTGFYETLEKKTDLFLAPIAKFIKDHELNVCLNQRGSMFSFFFGLKSVSCFEDLIDLDKEMFYQFFKTLFKEGIYISPSAFEASFLSIVHKEEHLIKTQQVILEFLEKKKDEIKTRSIKIECATQKN